MQRYSPQGILDGLKNLLRRGHLRILASCCVANPRRSPATAAVCAWQAIQNRSAHFPQQVLQTILFIMPTTPLDDLPLKGQIFAFLSIIHPEGKEGARRVFANCDLLGEDGENGNPDEWLFHLYMYDEMDVEGECVLYMIFSDDMDANEEKDGSQRIIRDLEIMAGARECKIDWGGDASAHAFRIHLGIDGLLSLAGRSLRAQGYSLWRDKSPLSLTAGDHQQYSGWISKSADDETLQALCALLHVPLERLG